VYGQLDKTDRSGVALVDLNHQLFGPLAEDFLVLHVSMTAGHLRRTPDNLSFTKRKGQKRKGVD
jgi:hypothetical protein